MVTLWLIRIAASIEGRIHDGTEKNYFKRCAKVFVM